MSSVIHFILDKLKIQYTEFKGGRELKFRCVHPKHQDNNPSAFINTDTGLWYCFSCTQKGNINTLLRYVKGEEAELSQFLDLNEMIQFKISSAYNKSEENMLMYDNIAEFYETIKYEMMSFVPAHEHDDSLDYLKSRGFTLETIKEFELMYASYGNYENRIIIPYKDLSGNILGFNSRYILECDKKFRYMYFLSDILFDGYIYNKKNVKDNSYCVLVEGPFDLMKLHQYGIKNVISTLNTRVVEDHIDYLLKFDKIVFCFDNDIETHAGDKAVKEAVKLIYDINPAQEMLFCQLPEGKDPDSVSKDEFLKCFNKLKRITMKKTQN